jgi:transposase
VDKLKKYLAEHPALLAVYDFKQELVSLLLNKHQTARHCKYLIPKFLDMIRELLDSHFEPMKTLGKTLKSWVTEIVRMWRFTKTNGITEGFHNKMEMMSRRAYGFRNFQNYRMKVRVMCS